MEDIDLDSLNLGSITVENCEKVHQMCESNIDHMSQPFQTFKRATLESDLFDPNLSIVATNDKGDVVAFFMAVLREPFVFKKRRVAVLKFFIVDKRCRYKGIGIKIFNLIHSKISENKCFRMKFQVLTSLPDYWYPGLDPRNTEAYFFLKKLGFKKGHERINLCVDLSTIPDKEPPSEHRGFIITRATQGDRDELVPIKFMPKGYQLGFWPQEINLTFRDDPIPTFIAKDQDGKIIGWASHSIHFPGSFGPTGVKKSLQGQGLGGVLLNWCLWDIRKMGLKVARIMWVEGNTVYFYLKSKGAKICDFFWTMRRRV